MLFLLKAVHIREIVCPRLETPHKRYSKWIFACFSNKCNNEKRRREQENNYIEELAELISANIADMSTSVKPDKCAILQEAVNQIRSIKQETTTQSSDPVQQGEVSSSRPTILSNELYGPLLLEALEGFLFVVNSEGKVNKNTMLLKKNLYNYFRVCTHFAQFFP